PDAPQPPNSVCLRPLGQAGGPGTPAGTPGVPGRSASLRPGRAGPRPGSGAYLFGPDGRGGAPLAGDEPGPAGVIGANRWTCSITAGSRRYIRSAITWLPMR